MEEGWASADTAVLRRRMWVSRIQLLPLLPRFALMQLNPQLVQLGFLDLWLFSTLMDNENLATEKLGIGILPSGCLEKGAASWVNSQVTLILLRPADPKLWGPP